MLTFLAFGKPPILNRKAVNVGSDSDPVWYAQEHLRIVPYQMLTRTVPEHLTSSMVEQAALDPAVTQRLIEREGFAHVGLDEIKNEKVNFVSHSDVYHQPTCTDHINSREMVSRYRSTQP